MAKPKICHLAIMTVDPEKLARFYQDVFGMEVVNRSETGGVFMTDGYFNLALLLNKSGNTPSGLYHFGFQVDDKEDIRGRLEQAGVNPPARRPDHISYAEIRGRDPDGNLFDISESGYLTVRPGRRQPTREEIEGVV
jgi:catechol 2,3-dioxygenase-like lactoylglutathione lyase family enzyme